MEAEEDDTLEADGEDEVDPDEAEFRRGPPLLLSRVDFLAPWYATPFRLIISLLLD